MVERGRKSALRQRPFLAKYVTWRVAGLGTLGLQDLRRRMRETSDARYIRTAASPAENRSWRVTVRSAM